MSTGTRQELSDFARMPSPLDLTGISAANIHFVALRGRVADRKGGGALRI